MTLLEEFEDLCKYVREVTGSDLVCGLCEYDAGTVGEEPIECPGFDSNECFVLKESLRKQYELYEQVIRCKDCKFSKAYYHGSESNLGMFTYLCTQGLYGMNADDYCSRAERKDDIVIIHPEDIVFNSEEDEKAYYEALGTERKDND